MAGDINVHMDVERKLAAIGAAIRALGDDRTIVNNLTKRLRGGFAALLRDKLKESATATLPKRGGLGARVARATYRLSVRRGAGTAGVSVVISQQSVAGRADLRSLDEFGTVRHPLFGNRKHWYPQTVASGFASNVVQGPGADDFRDEVMASIDDAIGEVLHAG